MAVPRQKVETVLASLAGRRHSAVTRAQLLAAGLSRHQIGRLVTAGRLLPVHDGVYLVADTVRPPLAFEAAAVLSCRPRALLARRTAAQLWKWPIEAPERIEVAVVGRRRRSPPGLRVLFLTDIERAEVRRYERLPITSPSLTLLDLAGVAGFDELEGALHEARTQRMVKDRELRATLAAHPNRKGAKALRHLLDHEGGIKITRSKAERRLLKMLRAHGLEPDASDYPIGPYRLDFYFEPERVAVEYDSRQFHDNAKRFVHDRRRVAYLAARGILTVPFTAKDLGAGADRAMADLRATLASRRRNPGFSGRAPDRYTSRKSRTVDGRYRPLERRR
jgi:very-short-patch-repair endonuclease